MNTKNSILAAAVALTLAAFAPMALADSVLDEGLGGNDPKAAAAPKPPAPTAPAAAPEIKPEPPKLTRPKMPDLVSPDAAKIVDDADLTDKLTGKGADGGGAAGPAQKMQEVMDRMGQASARLKEQQDPGMVTQETQRRIVTDLDVMIELLKKQQQQGGGKGSGDPKPGDAQKKSQSQGQQSGPGQSMGGNEGATDSNMRPGSAETPVANDTDIHQTGTNWGGLPPGDRELVAHGANEHYLPEYRDMIKKYYEALAEIGRTRGR